MTASGGWDGSGFQVEDVRFVASLTRKRESDAFTIMKQADLVARDESLLAELHEPRMVELGIGYGGSVAFFALRARPRKLVCLEHRPERLAQLDRFIHRRGLTDRVRLHFGVDQGDRERVASILSDELGHEPLDLVVDDASHRYGPTLASFETIFPRLRPDGSYIIEDWAGLHEVATAFERRLADVEHERHAILAARINERIEAGVSPETPLSRLVIELMLTQTTDPGIVDEVCVNRHWIAVRRGRTPLEPGSFRLADHYTDPFGMVRP